MLKDVPVSAQAVVTDVGEVSDKIVALGNETTLVDEKVCLLLKGQPRFRVRSHGAHVPPDKEDPPVCMLGSRGQAGLLTIVYHIHRETVWKSQRTKRQMILKTPWPASFFSAAANIAFSWSTEKLSAYISPITGQCVRGLSPIGYCFPVSSGHDWCR